MVRNEEKYQQAVEFRKRGFTYSEIAKICDVSKSTVSSWLSGQRFSQTITKENKTRAVRDNKKRLQLLSKARLIERKSRYLENERLAETEFKHYKKDALFVAGLILYSTNGDISDPSRIRLTTNKFEAHRVFIKFCVEYLGVKKSDITFWLLLSGKTPLETTLRWWSKKIGLSPIQFGKTQFVNPKAKSTHGGTGNTIIGSKIMKLKLLRWIEMINQEL